MYGGFALLDHSLFLSFILLLWRAFRIQKTQCILLYSQSPADPLDEATIGGTCASVQTFVPYKGFTASGSLDPHKQCQVLTKGLCGLRLACFSKTELFWISLMKLGTFALLSRLGQPFTQKKYALTQRLQAYLPQNIEIRKEELLKNLGQPCKLNEAMFLENVH